jgi:hypothetical protein
MRKCIVVKLKFFEDLFFENVFVVQRTVLVFKSSGIRALVLDCPDPYRVPVANSEPSCWLAQVQTKCWSRMRGPRDGLPRSQQSAGHQFGARVSDCPDPSKMPVANSGPSCQVAQTLTKCRSLLRVPRVGLPRSQKMSSANSEPSCRIAQIPTKCRSCIRRRRDGLPRSRQSASREFEAIVSDWPDAQKDDGREFGASCRVALIPAKCRSRIRRHRVGLTRSRQSAGREFGAFVSDCPDPDKVSVANSGPSCRVVQIPTKCRPRIRSPRVGLTRSRQSAGREFGALVLDCPDPNKKGSRRLRRAQIRGCRILQLLIDPSALCVW